MTTYYPARIAKIGENRYQLAQPKNTDQYNAFKLLIQCRVKHKHPDIDPEPENNNFTPPPAVDPKAYQKGTVMKMSDEGVSLREIAKATQVPKTTVARWLESKLACVPTISNMGTKMEMNGTLSKTFPAVESPPSQSQPMFQCTTPKLASPATETSIDQNQSQKEQILECLATGKKKTAEIISAVSGHNVAIHRQLKRLVDADEIIRVRHGVYDLPVRQYGNTLLNNYQNPRARHFIRLAHHTGNKCRTLIKKRVLEQYSPEQAESLNYYLSVDTNGEANNLLYQTPQTDAEKRLMAEQLDYYRAAILTEDPSLTDIFPPFCGIPVPDFLNELP